MIEHQLTNQELFEALKEQLYFLDSSLHNFLNNEIESKRIATTIRVLVHDTNKSNSLLNSLNKKQQINFINSAIPNDGRLHSMTGMKNVRGSNPNQYTGLVAKINDYEVLTAVPLFQMHLPEWHNGYSKLLFEDWWKMEIIKINSDTLTRREVVLLMANKDGGAHLDITLPEPYHFIKESKLILNIGGRETEFEKRLIYATVAQIGWEVKFSIENYLRTIPVIT